jgi:hypothetical protein
MLWSFRVSLDKQSGMFSRASLDLVDRSAVTEHIVKFPAAIAQQVVKSIPTHKVSLPRRQRLQRRPVGELPCALNQHVQLINEAVAIEVVCT